jgi:hypothetical protein
MVGLDRGQGITDRSYGHQLLIEVSLYESFQNFLQTQGALGMGFTLPIREHVVKKPILVD